VIAVEKLAAEPGAVIEFGEAVMIADGAEIATGATAVAANLDKVYAYFPRLQAPRDTLAGYGERQMTAIGRALIARPKMILLDEPSLGLAPQLVEEIFAILGRLNAEERVSFLVAKQNTNIALRYARHGYVLENGRIVMEGAAAALRANEDIKEFYLGLSAIGRKNYREIKHYRRRKRWRGYADTADALADRVSSLDPDAAARARWILARRTRLRICLMKHISGADQGYGTAAQRRPAQAGALGRQQQGGLERVSGGRKATGGRSPLGSPDRSEAAFAKPLRGFGDAGVLEIVDDREAKIPVTESSGNVFADMGLPQAKEELTTAQLASHIRQVIKRRRLTQVAAASMMGIDQLKVSALLNGRLANFSTERLMRLLTALGQDVHIMVKSKPRNRVHGRIRVLREVCV
jgi:predicted XRE-type DNA-binding protein